LQGNVESGELRASKVLLMLHQQRTDQKSDLYLLTRLIETLKDLKILHQSFRFRIKLADFDIDAKADVAALILDWFQVNESGKMPYFNKPCLRPIINYSIFLILSLFCL
jgi:hypothetical protein